MADDNFADLQKNFFAAFIQAVGYSVRQPALVVQPAPPIVGQDEDEADTLLWNYFNAIPPYTITANTTLTTGAQFLATYSAVMAALQSPPNNFESTIGEACFDGFNQALANGAAQPTPIGYRNWAMLTKNCSSNAVAGASAYAAALLDPIFAGQNNALPYKPVGKKSVDFVPGYRTMMKQLKTAPSRRGTVTLSSSSAEYDKTWTGGSQSAVFGLWANSQSNTHISQKFASADVRLNVSFTNLLPFNATPGDWYTSSALGIAYSNKGNPPWVPTASKTWDNTFSDKGDMQRFTTSLLIANEMKLTYESVATFTSEEQTEIKSNSSAGLWPFYNSGGGSYSYNDVSFSTSGSLMVTTTTVKNTPTIVGAVIEPASTYLGFAAEVAKAEVARLRK